ncbi:MAG TPA: hypothetical protein VIY73_07875 [Polyangiaceae bacterium]
MTSKERASLDLVPLVAWLLIAAASATAMLDGLTGAALAARGDVRLQGRESLIWAAACGVIFVLSGTMALWRWGRVSRERSEGGDTLEVVHVSRARRLKMAREYLPSPIPAGWSAWTSARGTATWRSRVGDMLILAWMREDAALESLHVAIAHAESEAPVDDARASAILERFRGISEFMEADAPWPNLEELHPGIRCWVALPPKTMTTLKDLPAPTEPPALPESPLRALVRPLLPEKLPAGWSPPVGVEELTSGWVMIAGRRLLFAAPVPRDRTRLRVSILGSRDEGAVGLAEAMETLRHFRGVSAFRQTRDLGGVSGSRTFVADIEGATPGVGKAGMN